MTSVSSHGRRAQLCFAVILGLLAATAFESTPLQAARAPFDAYSGNRFPAVAPAFSSVVLEETFQGINLPDPLDLLELPNEEGWLIVSKRGVVYWTPSPNASELQVVLDRSLMTATRSEGGMYSLVLHPEFGVQASPNRRAIFVYYQHALDNPGFTGQGAYVGSEVKNRLSRFELKPDTVEVVTDSETVLFEQRDRGVWHQGGAMLFHPFDGFLYLTTGDEGVQFQENMQILTNNLFSGVLRIDVRAIPARSHAIRRQPKDGTTTGYGIPNDNPFLDPEGGVLEEFFAVGLRSPHTLTCDPVTGDLWCGDVGSSLFDEINRIVPGGNYGWGTREGFGLAYFPAPDPPPGGAFRDPYIAYSRTSGPSGSSGDSAVICGPIYRGEALRDLLYGNLVFGDNTSGRIWSLSLNEDPAQRTVQLLAQVAGGGIVGLSRIVTDRSGEVYCLQLGSPGRIWKLSATDQSVAQLPQTLSATGVFSDLSNLTPSPGMTAYEINQPFWSDGAEKRRWVGIPNDGAPFDANETATLRRNDPWSFPSGTIFVKHFDMPITNQGSATSFKLATRLLIVDENSETYGFTYRWRADQSDADLVLSAETRAIDVTPDKQQDWYFPAPSDCRTCHNPTAGFVLGLNTRQMNLELPGIGNQIEHWEAEGLGAFASDRGSAESWRRLAPVGDNTATLTERIKTYLDVNCAFCHQPGGRGPTFDARLETPAVFQSLVDQLSQSNRLGGRERIVAAGSPTQSELLARLDNSAAQRMPPVGRNQVDQEGINLIRAWISALRPSDTSAGFAAHYFADENLEEPVASRLDSGIDHDWGSGAPDPAQPNDSFSVRWTGDFTAPETGDFFISVAANDGVRVLLNGKHVVNEWTGEGSKHTTISRFVSEGEELRIVVEYRDLSGTANCSVTCRLNDTGPNLFTSAHVRVDANLIQTETRPLIGLDKGDTGRVTLKFFAEGQAVRLEESLDLKTWSHVTFPDQANEMLLNSNSRKFFRVTPE